MNYKILVTFAVLLVVSLSSFVELQAQHSDIEFGYDDPGNPAGLVMDNDFRTIENVLISTSEFEVLDPFNPNDFSSDEPGFATNAGEGFILNAGDRVWIELLNAAEHSIFGAGFVNFCDATTNQMQATGRIAVLDNSSATTDLILDGSEMQSGQNPVFVDLANSNGSIHDHIDIDLLDDATAPLGAYGLLCQIHSDQNADGEGDISSEPFWIVWNHGLSDEEFDSALKHFGFGLSESVSDSLSTFRGTLVAGELLESQQSDDSYLVYQPGFTINNTESPVWLEFETTFTEPTGILVVAMEDQVSSVNLLRTIELMNWNTNSFEEVSAENSSLNQDTSLLLNVSADDFVEQGTGRVVTRVGWRANGFLLNFPWTVSLDQLSMYGE